MAITPVNAHYGSFSFFLTEDDADTDNEVIIDTTAWQGNWACDYVPVTPSGSGNGTLVLPVIGTASWTVSFPYFAEDSTPFDPTFLGIVEGAVLYQAFFGKGDSGLFDVVDRTTITSIGIMNNNGSDAVRVILTGMGGRVSEDET